MLTDYMNNLQNSIHWAHQQDDIDVLCLARDNMDRLLAFVGTLGESEQLEVHEQLNDVLPMEWPLWMEACRYGDTPLPSNPVTLH